VTVVSPGAVVSASNATWVVRAPSARPGFWHLSGKDHRTRVARTGQFHVIARAPVFKPGDQVKYRDKPATVVEDRGNEVTLTAGVFRIDVSKTDLVLDQL
jgi:hypothetical protein